jgi:hypothetical protein
MGRDAAVVCSWSWGWEAVAALVLTAVAFARPAFMVSHEVSHVHQ